MSFDFLYIFFVITHVIICLFLIFLVLLQNDKGGGIAGALGGMGSQGAFSGTSSTSFITRFTQIIAIISFCVILILNVLSNKKAKGFTQKSILKQTNNSSYSNFIPKESQLGIIEAPTLEGIGLPKSNDAKEDK